MKFKKLTIFIIIFIMAAIIIDPPRYIASARIGLTVFAMNVIPSLFPFMFLTKLLIETGGFRSEFGFLGKIYSKIFNLPRKSFYIFLLAAVCGYPIGAKLISEGRQRGELTDPSAKKLTALCSNASMIFLIGTVGCAMLGSLTAGIIIYLSNLVACILTAILMSFFYREKDFSESYAIPQVQNAKGALFSAMSDSVMSVFIVGGYITLFSVIGEALVASKIVLPLQYLLGGILSLMTVSPHVANGIVSGLLEFTNGCNAVSTYGLNVSVSAPICAFMTGFGGLSVSMQCLTYLKQVQIKTSYYFLTKILHGIISLLLSVFLLLFIR